MNAAERRRIEALIEAVTEALDEPALPPELLAAWQRFRASPRRSHGVLVMLKMQEMADSIQGWATAAANEMPG